MRVRLDPEHKTVVPGALWSEEALPIESVLAGLVLATPVKQKGGAVPDAGAMLGYLNDLVERGAVQLGGKATVGRGLCRLRLAKGEG
jgi:CRISPR-associated protein Cmr4